MIVLATSVNEGNELKINLRGRMRKNPYTSPKANQLFQQFQSSCVFIGARERGAFKLTRPRCIDWAAHHPT